MTAYKAKFDVLDRGDAAGVQEYLASFPGMQKLPRTRGWRHVERFEMVEEGEFIIQLFMFRTKGGIVVELMFAMCSSLSVDGIYLQLLKGLSSSFGGTVWLDSVPVGSQFCFESGEEEALDEAFR